MYVTAWGLASEASLGREKSEILCLILGLPDMGVDVNANLFLFL
jgi:hypothetical protein